MNAWLSLLAGEPEPSEIEDYIGLNRRTRSVAVVTLARPEKRNALSLGSWKRLAAVFGELGDDPELRAVVVRGAGDLAFGAGADIAEFPSTRMTAPGAVDYNESIARALAAIGQVPVPVIAMIRGLAVGGGCELAAACDVRVAANDARFGIPIGRLGVTLGYTETRVLVNLIGRGNLKRLLFEGDLIDAAEALRIGLIEVSVPPEDVVRRTAAMVDAIAGQAPVTMRAAKLVSGMGDRELTGSDTELLTRITVEAYGGPDLREGVGAFLEHRRPNFAMDRKAGDVGV